MKIVLLLVVACSVAAYAVSISVLNSNEPWVLNVEMLMNFMTCRTIA